MMKHMIFNRKVTFMKTSPKLKLSVLVIMSCFAHSSQAIDLVTAFERAQQYDPSFQSAIAEKDANKAQAVQAWASYLPTARFTNTKNDTEASATSGARQTWSASQPIFDAAKGATFLQGSARSQFADSTFDAKQHDLAQRTLKAVNQIITANEALIANEKRIQAFDSQYQGAKRKFDLGQGTITDLRDIEVKFQQAKADQLTLKANKTIAERQFASITGEAPMPTDFKLPNRHGMNTFQPLGSIVEKVQAANPQVLSARANEKINKLESAKSTGALLPTVSATWTRTEFGGTKSEYSGVAINFPLEIGGFVGAYGASAKAAQAINQRRDTEEKAKVETERLYQLVEAGQEALKIKRSAVESAELSVEANQKSFQAGVRSTTDVLNSIQVLFQTKNDYATAATQQADNLLNLLLIGAENPTEAVKQTQAFLFSK
jgi:protease secretion system outer membrane protein